MRQSSMPEEKSRRVSGGKVEGYDKRRGENLKAARRKKGGEGRKG
jgi:hypothetical protein